MITKKNTNKITKKNTNMIIKFLKKKKKYTRPLMIISKRAGQNLLLT